MIQLHEDKCIRCLRCADKCVCGAIEVRDGKPVVNHEKGCIKCMHCAIACPENAISYGEQPAILNEEMPVLADTFSADLENFLLTKRSYRNFKPEPVPMTEIESALNAAAWAPSAKNQHPTKYYVVSGQEEIDAMMALIVEYLRESGDCPEVLDGLADGLNKVFGKAQSVIIAYARNNANRPSEDTTIALTYAELVLQARGIGTCWSGYLQRFLNRCDKLAAMFPIPENNAFYGCMLLGYPTEEYFYIPRRLKLADIKTLK